MNAQCRTCSWQQGRYRICEHHSVSLRVLRTTPAHSARLFTHKVLVWRWRDRRCVVVEDSRIGTLAAKAAGMTCVVTKSSYTQDEDFSGANAVFDQIGDSEREGFDLEYLTDLCQRELAAAGVRL